MVDLAIFHPAVNWSHDCTSKPAAWSLGRSILALTEEQALFCAGAWVLPCKLSAWMQRTVSLFCIVVVYSTMSLVV